MGYEANAFSISDGLELLLEFKVSLQFGSDSLCHILRCTHKPVYVYCVVLIQGDSEVTLHSMFNALPQMSRKFGATLYTIYINQYFISLFKKFLETL